MGRDLPRPRKRIPDDPAPGLVRRRLLLFVVIPAAGLLLIGGCLFWIFNYAPLEDIWPDIIAENNDPAQVVAKCAQIADFETPANFAPDSYTDVNSQIWSTGRTEVYFRETRKPHVWFRIQELRGGAKMSRQELFDRERDASPRDDDPGVLVQTPTYTVRGQPEPFRIVRGISDVMRIEVWKVSGCFESKRGLGAVLMFLDTKRYSEQDIRRIVESIH